MKSLLASCAILAAMFVWAGAMAPSASAAAGVVKGEVLEAQDVDTYTYLRLKTADGDIWAAVGKAMVSKGADVTIENATVMQNFASRALNKTFPTIVFGTLAGEDGGRVISASEMAKAHAGVAKAPDGGEIRVAKAEGANAFTVAEIVTRSVELKDQAVLVRGKIVKYNPGILGKNWIHLRDGSGSAEAGSNDLLVTSTDEAKSGDVVTVTGIVRTDKDFGSGYSYKVLVEEATLRP